MDKDTVSKMLENAEKEDLLDIISNMSQANHKAEKIILDWCKKNNKSQQKKAAEIELENLWQDVQPIINEFNQYGGGPDSEMDEVCDNLWKMYEIVKQNDISWETRVVILDKMLEEFNIGNSGFDDILIDVASSFCNSPDENRYFADALAKGSSGYYRNYAAQLYRHIGDEDQFLKTKLDNLRYGSDYVEVAKYYAEKRDRKKEMEYIWKGLERCNGRLDELINYVAPIYIKENRDAELQRLYQFILKTKTDLNIFAMAKQMYKYYSIKNDYESRKRTLLLILDTCQKDEIKKWFKLSKSTLYAEDWQKEYEGILEKVKKTDQKFYLDICMETGREDIVLTCLQNTRYRYDYCSVDYNQYFSKRLAEKYPNEILEIYWGNVNNLLTMSNNKNYETAVFFLQKIKALMKKNEKLEEWEIKFRELKEKNKRKRNFIALVKNL